MPPVHADAIADCVLVAFRALSAKCKPRTLSEGRREWVPLAGIVLSRSRLADRTPSHSPASEDEHGLELVCAALATGMKCLPQSKLPLAKGNVLHDFHAEVLAIRAFNRWLLDECAGLAGKSVDAEHQWLRRRFQDRTVGERVAGEAVRNAQITGERGSIKANDAADQRIPPFAIRDDVGIHMYCSQAPCGDASMELVAIAQDDSTPWTSQPPVDEMLGRGNFDRLGIVRRKPARPDAPITLSKSCSDKLAMKQCTSLLSGVVSLLVHPGNAYLQSLVLPEQECVPEAVQRAFSWDGRMSAVNDKDWTGGYTNKPFEVQKTSREFEYSKAAGTGTGTETVPSNLSAVYTSEIHEVLINGVLQGRKQTDPRGASLLSRRRTWESVQSTLEAVGTVGGNACTYSELKACHALRNREFVKRQVREVALRGWLRNVGDESWTL